MGRAATSQKNLDFFLRARTQYEKRQQRDFEKGDVAGRPLKHACPHLSYHANSGSNCTSVMETSPKNLTPRVSPFKVTQCNWN